MKSHFVFFIAEGNDKFPIDIIEDKFENDARVFEQMKNSGKVRVLKLIEKLKARVVLHPNISKKTERLFIRRNIPLEPL